MPTIISCEGFEHQTLNANRFGGSNTSGLWTIIDDVGGVSSFIAGRTGTGKALRIATNASTARHDQWVSGTGGHRVFSFYFRATGIPSVATIFTDTGVGSSGMGVFFRPTTGYMYASVHTNSSSDLTINFADGNWHRLDYHFDTTADPWVLTWQVDGNVGPSVSSPVGSQAADTTGDSQFRFGRGSTSGGIGCDYDDLVCSLTGADYPIGPHRVLALFPHADGTHAAGVNVIEDSAGVDIVTPNAFGLMDEWPANTSDYVRQFATGASNYAEITFQNTAETTIWYVKGAAALFSSGVTANSGTTRTVDSGGTTLTDIYASDMSETSLHYRTATIAVPSGGSWDQTKLNGVKARVGFSGNVATLPQWSAMLLQYAVPGEFPAATITANHLLTEANAAAQQDYTTSSISPTANRLLVVTYNTRRNDSTSPDIPTVTGNGLTWTLVQELLWDDVVTSFKRIYLYAAWTGASPSAGGITFDHATGGQTSASWLVTEFAGTDGANGVAQTFVQSVETTVNAGGVGPLALTLASPSHADNRPYCGFCYNASSAQPDADAGPGWTELGNTANVDTSRCHASWRSDVFDTSVNPTWADVSSQFGGIAVEIKAASSVQTTDKPRLLVSPMRW